MNPLDFADSAIRLFTASGLGIPPEADLRRALGAIYYAYFRALCLTIADLMIGDTEFHRGSPIWIQAFKSLEHRRANAICLKVANTDYFPQEIRDLANILPSAQHKRFQSDYGYIVDFSDYDVLEDAVEAKRIIENFMNAPKEARLEFVAMMVLPERKQ